MTLVFTAHLSSGSSNHQGLERVKAEKDPSETHQRQVWGWVVEMPLIERPPLVVPSSRVRSLRLQSITLNARALHRNPGIGTRKHIGSFSCINPVSTFIYTVCIAIPSVPSHQGWFTSIWSSMRKPSKASLRHLRSVWPLHTRPSSTVVFATGESRA